MSYILYRYCSPYLVLVEKVDSVCQSCGANVLKEEATSSFIEVSIEERLQVVFAKRGFQRKTEFQIQEAEKGKR